MRKGFGEDELELRVTIEDTAPYEKPERATIEEGRLCEVKEGSERLVRAIGVGAIRGACVPAVDGDG